MHRSLPGRRLLRAGLVAGLVIVLAVVTGCAGDRFPNAQGSGGVSAAGKATSTTTDEPGSGSAGTAPSPARSIGFGVVGDSLTVGPGAALGAVPDGSGSWLPAARGAPLEFRGGWALPGARTGDMRAGVGRVDAAVLVVLAGTNDVLEGIPWQVGRRNLLAVVAAAGIDEVVLVAVPPLDQAPFAAAAYAFGLAELAADRGWQYVDPWTADADPGTGRWAPGASLDGIHPTPPVADRAGRVIRAALLATAGAREGTR